MVRPAGWGDSSGAGAQSRGWGVAGGVPEGVGVPRRWADLGPNPAAVFFYRALVVLGDPALFFK